MVKCSFLSSVRPTEKAQMALTARRCVHRDVLKQLNVALDVQRNASACSCLAFTQAKFHCSAGGEKKKIKK